MLSHHACFSGSAHHHQHPGCTEIETLQAQMEQMSGPGTCGPVVSNSSFGVGGGGGNTGTGNRSNRSRRGSSRATMAMDAIDIIDPAKGEKTVNFANCVSPPSPHDPGIMGINNEAYPCDCCQIDEAAFRRSYTHQIPCGSSTGAAPPPPNGSTMHFSEVSRYYYPFFLRYYPIFWLSGDALAVQEKLLENVLCCSKLSSLFFIYLGNPIQIISRAHSNFPCCPIYLPFVGLFQTV